MKPTSDNTSEADRVKALQRYDILDTPPDAVLDCITQAAKDLCDTPIALISLVDTARQWFKARVGLSVTETPRDVAFCSHAIQNPGEILEVEDATKDERFRDNPLVTGEPLIRFYAGKPLVTSDGFALGTLCVIDYKPRRLSESQRNTLSRLGEAIVNQFEAVRQSNISAMERVNERNEIYVCDSDSYHILNMNRSARENLGYSIEESLNLMPFNFVETITPDNIEQWFTQHGKTAEKNKAMFESVHKRKDNSTYPVSMHLHLMTSQEPPVYVAIVQDITERQAYEENMRLRERAIEAVDVGVTITDATKKNHPLVYVNETLCKMTGYSKAELTGKGVRVLQKNNDHQPEHRRIEAAQARGEPVQVRFKSTRKDGSQYTDELSLSPVLNNEGKLTHYIGVNRDVTEKLDMEAKLHHSQKIEAIGQLTGGIAHDFNNHLSVIMGNLEFLEMDITNADHQEYIREATNAAKMGARLTNRLLTFARQGHLEPATLDANEHILHAIDLLRSTIGAQITLSTRLATDLWHIRADPSEVENTVVNLVINARDAMVNEGTITVETKNIRFAENDAEEPFGISPGDYIQLSVTDTGCGMSEEVKSKIFEPFFTTKETGKGTGLGLASIYGFVQQSGGHVYVYSEIDHGTVVNIYLPKYDKQKSSTLSTQAVELQTTNVQARVLVIEDNEMVRKLTVKRLQALGYTTKQARNGPEALKILEHDTKFDLILTDIVMDGGLTGFDIAWWVQSNLPQCKILLTSGFNEKLAEKNSTDIEKLQILQKPHSLAELQTRINALLES